MRDYQTKQNVGGVADSITVTKLGAGETNSALVELENSVSRSGQTLAPADGTGEDTTQLAQSLFIHGVKSTSFQDNGSANTIQLTPISGSSGVLLPSSYANLGGARIAFRAAATNTGATTLNIGQTAGTLLGSKDLLASDGSALTGGEIVSGKYYEVRYDLSSDDFYIFPWSEEQTGGVTSAIAGKGIAVDQATGDVTFSISGIATLQIVSEAIVPANTTTTIPADDTVPLISEGVEVQSLSITPSSTSSKVRVKCNANCGAVGGGGALCVAVFRDSTCIFAANRAAEDSYDHLYSGVDITDEPTTTSSVTYSIRIGVTQGAAAVYWGDSFTPRFGDAAHGGGFYLEEIL